MQQQWKKDYEKFGFTYLWLRYLKKKDKMWLYGKINKKINIFSYFKMPIKLLSKSSNCFLEQLSNIIWPILWPIKNLRNKSNHSMSPLQKLKPASTVALGLFSNAFRSIFSPNSMLPRLQPNSM